MAPERWNEGYTPTAYELYLGNPKWSVEIRDELGKKFFASIRLKNGTYKFTYGCRLDDLNELTKKFLPPERPLNIMDIAISSGISTLEWMQSLKQAGINYQMTAGDATVNCFLLSVGSHLHVLTDSAGYPLQFDIYGKAVPNPSGKRNWAVFALPLTILRCALAIRNRDLRRMALGTEGLCRHFGTELRPIKLVISRLQNAPDVQIVQDDILTSNGFQSCFHVLRAANILNRGYFDDSTLTKMVRNLRSRLLSGGILVVCRTSEQKQNHATLFALGDDQKFTVLGRLGKGSEIEDLVLDLPGQISAG